MQVVFDFAPAPGSYVFDLIVTESLDGIMGTFDSFNVFNLDPMFKVTHGVEIAGGVDVYRLRIGTTLSEPSSLALLAASLALLGIVRRRKCGARSPARYA